MRRELAAFLVLGLLSAGTASAEPPAAPPQPTVVTNPAWLRRPTAEELDLYWPVNARDINGRAVIRCAVTARGTLDACLVEQETPPGRGFGPAALAMSSLFLMRPMLRNGVPVSGATVRIPIAFTSWGGLTAPAATLRVLHDAPWIAAPTAEQLREAYPPKARASAHSGHVVLRCSVTSGGGLQHCGTVSEAPASEGFAPAAMSVTKYFRMAVDRSAMRSGKLAVDVPFDFRNPSEAPAAPDLYDPIWIYTPAPEQLAALFPAAAMRAGYKEGQATVDCVVEHAGTLSGCVVASETPAGVGFGAAAAMAAAGMQMSAWTVQGRPVDGARIRLPIRLALPAAPPAPAKP